MPKIIVLILILKIIKIVSFKIKLVIPNYCTSTPSSQVYGTWPSSISYSISQIISASCVIGSKQGSSGVPRADCTAEGTTTGSGVWRTYAGSCEGIDLSGDDVYFYSSFKSRNVF